MTIDVIEPFEHLCGKKQVLEFQLQQSRSLSFDQNFIFHTSFLPYITEIYLFLYRQQSVSIIIPANGTARKAIRTSLNG